MGKITTKHVSEGFYEENDVGCVDCGECHD